MVDNGFGEEAQWLSSCSSVRVGLKLIIYTKMSRYTGHHAMLSHCNARFFLINFNPFNQQPNYKR